MTDSHALKLTWKVELEWLLVNDKNYRIALEWSITNVSTSPNGDGTYSNTYSFRPVRVLIHDELWDTIKAKDPRKQSEKLRSYLKYKFDQSDTNFNTFEEFYDDFFKRIYKNIDFLLS